MQRRAIHSLFEFHNRISIFTRTYLDYLSELDVEKVVLLLKLINRIYKILQATLFVTTTLFRERISFYQTQKITIIDNVLYWGIYKLMRSIMTDIRVGAQVKQDKSVFAKYQLVLFLLA